MRAKEIMTAPPITIRPEANVKELADLLGRKRISAVPVVDAEGNLVGIVSERDLLGLMTMPDPRLHADIARSQPVSVHAVAEVMRRGVVAVAEDEDAATVARIMLERNVKRVPVVSGRHVVGVIARRDMLKVLARSDAGIQEDVQARLDRDRALLGSFHASVKDGVVTLAGPQDEQVRPIAELIARCVAGVVGVRFADRTRVA